MCANGLKAESGFAVNRSAWLRWNTIDFPEAHCSREKNSNYQTLAWNVDEHDGCPSVEG